MVNPGTIGNILASAFAWQYVQSTANQATSVSFPRENSAGNLLLVCITKVGSGISTPTDTAGNTYVDSGAGEVAYGSTTATIRLYYCSSCKAAAKGNTVTSTGAYGITIIEFSGCQAASSVDVNTKTANGVTVGAGGQNMIVGPMTTTKNGDLIFVWQTNQNGNATTNTNWISTQNSAGGGLWQYQIQTVAGPITSTMSDNTASDNYCMIMAAFKHRGTQ